MLLLRWGCEDCRTAPSPFIEVVPIPHEGFPIPEFPFLPSSTYVPLLSLLYLSIRPITDLLSGFPPCQLLEFYISPMFSCIWVFQIQKFYYFFWIFRRHIASGLSRGFGNATQMLSVQTRPTILRLIFLGKEFSRFLELHSKREGDREWGRKSNMKG